MITFITLNILCLSGSTDVVRDAVTPGQVSQHCSKTLNYPNPTYVMTSKYLNAVCEASNFEKPGAVIPHAGICEGAVGQLAALP